MLSLWNKENRNLASTASTPYMAQTLYSLTCFLIGSDGTFQVKIDRTELVGNLKDAIKEKKPVALKDVDADQLTLYKGNIKNSIATNKPKRMKELERLSQNLSECTFLNDEEVELSEIFGNNEGQQQRLKPYVLVELPQGEPRKPVARSSPIQFYTLADNNSLHLLPCNDSLIIHYHRPTYLSLIVYHSPITPYRPTSTSTPWSTSRSQPVHLHAGNSGLGNHRLRSNISFGRTTGIQ